MSNRFPTNPAPQQYVNGKLTDASDGGTYEILNPATGAVIGHAPNSTADDVNEAIAAARRAFDETDWSTNLSLRLRVLRQFHQALLDNADQLRELTIAEVGAPTFLIAGPQFDMPVETVEWTIGLAESYAWETDLGVGVTMGIESRRTVRRDSMPMVTPTPRSVFQA